MDTSDFKTNLSRYLGKQNVFYIFILIYTEGVLNHEFC